MGRMHPLPTPPTVERATSSGLTRVSLVWNCGVCVCVCVCGGGGVILSLASPQSPATVSGHASSFAIRGRARGAQRHTAPPREKSNRTSLVEEGEEETEHAVSEEEPSGEG
eukprot:TRINITY_DN3855_c0_g1_i1.p3 TRINITY_DN3855_c0_g1~~TRINITY_DN3855_c0_g1_i1.p3  ORF type:complete len:111 (+),score=2.51 TRINITY_DN3855_c0_g1_i1:231-563(+)